MKQLRLFDTNVQELKYKVIKEIVALYASGKLKEGLLDIPRRIVPGPKATMRCCIYKERAIIEERIKLAMGQGEHKGRAVEILGIACDECPVARFSVSASCRGCIAHRCSGACPVGAISFEKQKAVIDHDKCIECGKCKNVCPYNAIIESQRPCIKGCASKAISLDGQKIAKIDYDKCTSCGNCVYQCPFGAIVDKSYILDAMKIAKESKNGKNYRAYAIIAPSIVSQFSYAKIGQIVSGIKKAGFHSVVEVALGADITAVKDAQELIRKGFLISSCCPAFVTYVKSNYPDMAKHISDNPSPMIEIARYIKQTDKEAKVVFIGPCIAKKEEFLKPEAAGAVDCAISFEELQALFDGLDIQVEKLPEEPLNNASYYGRIFARSGGVATAVGSVVKEEAPDFVFKPEICDGLEKCRIALLKASAGKLDSNFIEGMACEGGCIGGAGCLHHGVKSRAEVDEYGKQALAKTTGESLDTLKSLGNSSKLSI
jgi:[FeFe] hydrogenase (group B1/B3)